MRLPFDPPIEPMLAKAASAIPTTGGLLYEPKWDGFRCIVFRDGAEVYLQSRDKKPLLRYFPELAEPLRRALPDRCVVDGELVLSRGGQLDFDALQQRIHPAKSRVEMLAAKTPASFVAFDLLALGDDDLRPVGFAERRAALEARVRRDRPVHLTPITADPVTAQDWFVRFEGAGLDGVVAKGRVDPYHPGKRVMRKIKHQRTLECVVAGFRWHKHGAPLVGSLILGLWDDEGRLHQVGVAASFTAKRRRELADELQPWRDQALDGHPWAEWAGSDDDETRRPGVGSRWSQGKDLSWEPVRLGLVAEVAYNQLTSGRFRHPAQFLRWRDDKTPAECGYHQLDVTPAIELAEIFGS